MNAELVNETMEQLTTVLDESGLTVAEAMTAVLSLMTMMVDGIANEQGSMDIVELTRKHIGMAFDEIRLDDVGALH
jgi:hypothetical protein